MSEILNQVVSLTQDLVSDWDDPPSIHKGDRFITDLGFDSMDLVMLCMSIQNHYGVDLCFPKFLVKDDVVIDCSVETLAHYIEGSLA